MFGVEKFRINK